MHNKADSSRQKQGARNDGNFYRMISLMGKLQRGLMFAFGVILALGSTIAVTFGLMAAMQARVPILNDGASPTSMNSGNMPQAALSIHYNTRFLEYLKAVFTKLRMATRQNMPANAGQVFRNFMLAPLTANTVEQSEGTVGSGITVTTNYLDILLGQWCDFLNISDKAVFTSISNDLVMFERNLAYRLGYSIDDLTMALFDYLRTLDSKTSNQDVTTGNFQLTKQQVEQAPFSLMGQNVPPMEGGYYCGSIHPFFVGDLLALDNSNNSIVDIMKHTPEGQLKLEELPDMAAGDQVKVIELFGCRWMPSTNQTQTASFQGSSSTAVRTYLAGMDAVLAVKLSTPDRSSINDGQTKNISIWRGEYKPGSAFDPCAVIGAGTSYNFIGGFGLPPDTTSRARCFDAVPITT
jgi:hypothetical protein